MSFLGLYLIKIRLFPLLEFNFFDYVIYCIINNLEMHFHFFHLYLEHFMPLPFKITSLLNL